MNNKTKRMIAYALAWVMIFTTFFSSMAPMQVQAAEVTDEVIDVVEVVEETGDDLVAQETETPERWGRLASCANNGNGHFGSTNPEAFVLSNKNDIKSETISFTVKLMSDPAKARMRFVTKYVDDSNWGYIACDGGSGWFYEFKNGGTGSWPGLTGLPAISQGDIVNITISYTDTAMNVTVNNITSGVSGTATGDNTSFLGLKDQAGKIGFGAGYFNSDAHPLEDTDFCLGNVKVGETSIATETESYTFYRNVEGQSFTIVNNSDLEQGGGSGDGGNTGDGDNDGGNTGGGENEGGNTSGSTEGIVKPGTPEDGRAWWTLTAGDGNGGGHSYGGASAGPITFLYMDKKITTSTKVSVTVKPDNTNWGVFYNYKDDNNFLYIGYDTSSKWYYQYRIDGAENYPKITGLQEPTIGEEVTLTIALNRETLEVQVNDEPVVRMPNDALFGFENIEGHFGVMAKGGSGTKIAFADATFGGADCMNDTWAFAANRTGQSAVMSYAPTASVSGSVSDKETGTVIAGATVRIGTSSAKTDASGNFTFEKVEYGTHTVSVTKPGYEAYLNENVQVGEGGVVFSVELDKKAPIDLTKYDTISNEDMVVYVGKEFPVVARYEMKKMGSFFRGNETDLNTIAINGVKIVPTLISAETNEDNTAKSYKMNLVDADDSIDLTMTVVVSIKDNTLTWEVTELTKAENCAKIATIDVPGLNLLTVDATEEDAVFAGAQVSTTTTAKADTYITFDEGFNPSTKEGYVYAFLSNGNLSAGLFSNSEAEGDRRVIRNNGADNMGLSSAAWYYELGDSTGQKGIKNNPSKYADYYPVSELPYAKVAIADDINKDGDIDWNDGALAYRDIMHYAYGTEKIKDMVNYRIVMNFASMAPNPFLATADNIKKVYLATDGLPQSVMLKGYGNEGHDSANSEYADIAVREGGVEDFQDLIKIAHDYNTEIGIHVNAQEIYPEAKSFNETMVSYPNVSNGWGWLDQSHVIDKLWDLSSQARWKRFVQLYDRINNTNHLNIKWPEAVVEGTGVTVDMSKEELKKEAESLPDNMDFIYLDVWYQDAWETRRIAEEINSLGWRFSTEFSAEGEYDSTWQHWSTDAQYGGATAKGYNSDIIRFLRNDQRDSQVLNHPEFGGTADNPLLGGYRLYGFEGWGGDRDFNNYILQTFNQNLPTRFLQHYYVTDWTNYEEGQSPVGNTEKEITLMNDEGVVITVSRNEIQRNDTNIERTISYNGVEILNDVTYLLPWTDNQNGEVKLYHWNLEGGKTTWELTAGFEDCTSVIMYKLTDQGRVDKQVINVVDGKVTLNAEEATPYVLVKGEGVKTLVNDFGECDYVVDPGFNGYEEGDRLDAKEWSGDITDVSVVVEKSKNPSTGDQRLAFNSPEKTVAVTTQISGLTAGKHYVAEVNIQNDSEEKAYIIVNAGEAEISEYTEESIIGNYVKCDAKNGSKMQRMQVSFVAEGETAQLTLMRAAGEGSTYVDDIRIVEIELNNWREDEEGKYFVQDFEQVVQGLYPFVLSSAQGISDPVTHLSQLNAPYTQAGWNNRVIDDVIEGEWSLKHHGANTGIIYQTIPANFRFEAGKVYTVEFDYQSGPNKAYAMVIGDGASYTRPTEEDYLAQAHGADETVHVTMEVVGSGSGQTWIGLYERGSHAGSGSMGQTDFTLDNLVIRENKEAVTVTLDKTTIYLGETAQIFGSRLDEVIWESSDESVAIVDVVTQTVKVFKEGTVTLKATLPGEDTLEFVINVKDSIVSDIDRDEYSGITATANTEETPTNEPTGGGTASHAVDGNSGTFWHSKWSGSGFTVSETNPAVLTVDLGKEMNIGGFKFLQRTSGTNGVVSKFSYRALNANDEEVASGGREVTAGEYATGAWVINEFEEELAVRKIIISITAGYNDFAVIAEVAPIEVEFKEGEEAPAAPTYALTLSGNATKVYDGEAVSDNALTVSMNSAAVEGAVIKYYGNALMNGALEEAPVNAGNYWARAYATVSGNEYQSNVRTFSIQKAPVSIEDVVLEWRRDDNNEEHLAVKSVAFEGLIGEDSLVIDTDYRVNYVWNEQTNTVSGTVGLKNTEKANNYKLTVATFNKAVDVEKEGTLGIWVDGITDVIYNGTKQTFEDLKVYDGDKELVLGTDYTVSYKNNQNAYEYTDEDLAEYEELLATNPKAKEFGNFKAAKAPQVILKMKGTYTGSKTLFFRIRKADINDAAFEVDNLSATYTGKVQKPLVTVLWKETGKNLKANKEVVVTVKDSATLQNSGDYTLILKGTGNFTGEKEVDYVIGEKDTQTALSKVSIKVNKVAWSEESVSNNGIAAKAIKTIKNGKTPLVVDKDYVVKEVESADAVGTGYLVLEGKGNYIGTRKVAYTITGTAMSKVKAENLDKGYAYTGKEIEPLTSDTDLKITYKRKTVSGNVIDKLEKDRDYTVTYQKNENKGTATMILTGNPAKGYTGTKKVTFKITAAELNDKDYAVTVAEEVGYTTGGATPEVVVTRTQGEETTTLVKGVDYTVSYKNNKKVDATAQVIVKGKGNYAKSIDETFKIVKKAVDGNSDIVKLVVMDKEFKKDKKNNWKQSFKVLDENGKAISSKEYTAEYRVEGTEEVLEKNAIVEQKDIVLTVSFKEDSANYSGTLTKTFRLLDAGKDISKAKVKINNGKPVAYTGKAITLEVSDFAGTKLKGSEDKEFSYIFDVDNITYENNINKGTAKVTLRGNADNGYGGEKTVTFKIGQRSVVTNWWTEFLNKAKEILN